MEGNIGCGKSTLLKYFEKYPKKVQTLTEPIEKWTNLNGHNMLVGSTKAITYPLHIVTSFFTWQSIS